MSAASDGRRLVILPSYNSGPHLAKTLAAVRRVWQPVWAVLDGSTDTSEAEARALGTDGIHVIRLAQNQGKGAAVLQAFREAAAAGFEEALVMDADGQHPVESVPEFMALSQSHPGALIAGVPVFGPDAPPERVKGRRVGNSFAWLETLGRGAPDSLFGFRVYPIRPLIHIFESTPTGRRFDFDTVAAVRLCWAGVPVISRPVPVRYPPREEGGVTHFRYLRDNLLLARVHAGLLFGLLARLPRLLKCP